MTLFNDSDVLASIVFAEKLGSNLTLVPLMKQGCAENLIHRIPNAQKIKEAVEICMEANERMKGHHEVQIPQWYLANIDLFNKYRGLFAKNHRICPAGHNRLFINSKGDIFSCMFCPKPKFGNLLKDKITIIEKNINEFNDKIKMVEPQGKCKNCDAWNYCHGGCLASYYKTKFQMGNNCPMVVEK
jgi:radical SAM protein with 4Fe4S-binding SPASM domain